MRWKDREFKANLSLVRTCSPNKQTTSKPQRASDSTVLIVFVCGVCLNAAVACANCSVCMARQVFIRSSSDSTYYTCSWAPLPRVLACAFLFKVLNVPCVVFSSFRSAQWHKDLWWDNMGCSHSFQLPFCVVLSPPAELGVAEHVISSRALKSFGLVLREGYFLR